MILFGGMPGAIVVYGVGIVVTWRGLCWIGAGLAAAATLSSLVLVESPLWTLRYRQDRVAASRQLQAIRATVDAETLAVALEEYSGEGGSDGAAIEASPSWRELFEPSSRRPVLIMVGLLILNNLNGVQAVGTYTGLILQDSFGESRNLAALAVPSISPFACAIAMPIADRWGRRPLLLASSSGMALSCALLAATLGWATELGFSETLQRWMPLASLVCFMFFFQVGMGPLPGLVITELVPPRARGIGAAVVGVVAGLVGNATQYAVLPLRDLLGAGWLFCIYTAGAVIGTLFILFVIPETKGKTLEEISLAMRASGLCATGCECAPRGR
jgi:MFS family permease